VQLCLNVCERYRSSPPKIRGVSYYSDATVLLNGISAKFAIVGPGELGLSGQPDESVPIENVTQAAKIYAEIATTWLT